MSDESKRGLQRALVRAIVDADPDDDGPRLVYADYLQRLGDLRGELIAIQCREARTGDDALERRSLALFDEHAARWAGAWHGEAGTWRFRRGFLHHLATRVDTFAVIGELLFEQDDLPDELIHLEELELQPPLAKPVDLTPGDYAACSEHAAAVARLIARLRLRSLSLQLALSTGFARALSGPSLAHLVSLAIESTVVERRAVPALLQAPLERLVELRLQCRLVREDWEEIAQSQPYRRVRRLALTGDHETIITMIRANPWLTTLRLGSSVAGRSRLIQKPTEGSMLGWGPVVRAPARPTVLDVLAEVRPPLIELDLSNTWYGLDLSPLVALPTVERLDLHGMANDDTAVDALIQLPRLTSLNVSNTRISVAGLERLLFEAPPTLRELTIAEPPALPRRLHEKLAQRFVLHRRGSRFAS